MNIENNVISFVVENVKNNPHKTIFIYKKNNEWKKINNQEFYEKVLKFAEVLRKNKIEKGDRILIFLPISVELYVILAAFQIIGAVPVFLESWSKLQHIRTAIKNSQPKAVISLSKLFEKYGWFFWNFKFKMATDLKSRKKTVLSFYEELEKVLEIDEKIQPVSEDDTALITYTTGSSGVPKGADRTHKFLKSQHFALDEIFPYTDTDIDLPIFPVFALNNLAGGVTTVIPEIMTSNNLSEKDIEKLVKQIQELKINNLTLSPIIFNKLTRFAQKNNLIFPNIKRVLTGGAPVSEKDVFEFQKIVPQAKIWILYGSTEVEPISVIEASEMIEIMNQVSFNKKNKTNQGVVVGKIHKDLKHALIDINFSDWQIERVENIEVEKNEVGELIVAGLHVCEKYYKNEEAFKRAKIVDKTGQIWHRTGDVARIDKENNLWIVGRKHNLIKRDNQFLFPVRPEILLKEITGVEASAYLEVEKKGGKKIYAVLEMNTDDEIKKQVLKKFQEEKIPVDEVIFMDKIIMDIRHHSKVNYSAMRKKIQSDTKIKKWFLFLKERFCVFKILPMVVVFVLAHQKNIFTQISLDWKNIFLILIALLFFLKLRLFDEIKDYKTDLKIHPERPLPRGLLKKEDLLKVAVVISLIEIGLFSFYGLWWLVLITVFYSWLMFKEFCVSKWIRDKLTFYALTHTFVVSLFSLSIFSVFEKNIFKEKIFLFAFSAWLIFSLFEFGRKTFLKVEEIEGQNSYSKQFGIKSALSLSLISAAFGIGYLIMVQEKFLYIGSLLFLILLFLSLGFQKWSKWFRFYTMFIIFLIYFSFLIL